MESEKIGNVAVATVRIFLDERQAGDQNRGFCIKLCVEGQYNAEILQQQNRKYNARANLLLRFKLIYDIMSTMLRLIALIAGNALALFLASYYIPGFELTGNWNGLAIVTVVFSAINFFLKPILKFLLGPFILVTLGLLIIVINMAMLWLTDLAMSQLQIQTITALFYATILIGAVNFITHLIFKK